MLRQRLSNEEISDRLGISLDGAKYHVSEILGKLGVQNRREAALWTPDQRPWWRSAGALFSVSRPRVDWLSPAVGGALAVVIAVAVGLLVWALLATRGDDGTGTNELADTDVGSPTPFSVEDLSATLLTLDQLSAGWKGGLPLDQFGLGWFVGEEPADPPICAVRASPRAWLVQAEASFEHDVDDLGHGPFLYQAVAAFPEGGAKAFMDEVTSIIQSCPAEVELGPGEILLTQAVERATARPAETVFPIVTWQFSLLPIPELGEQSLAFKRALGPQVQQAEVDSVLIRRGDLVSFVFYFSLGGSFGGTDISQTEAFAHLADEKLRAFAER